MSKQNRKLEIPVCGCTGRGKTCEGGYWLRHMIATLDRINGQPVGCEINTKLEDGRRPVRQAAGRLDAEGKEGIAHDRGSA
jgi:hypothetical protein